MWHDRSYAAATRCVVLPLLLGSLVGCQAIAGGASRTQTVTIPAARLEELRLELQARPCAAGQRVTVVGAEDGGGVLHLAIVFLGNPSSSPSP